MDGRVLAIKLDIIKMDEKRAEPRVRGLDIPQSEAGINQNQSLIRFNKQTVADEVSRQAATKAIEKRPSNGTHTATIEMMNLHKCAVLNYLGGNHLFLSSHPIRKLR
ncbi:MULTISPECIES: hypothetical protein [unclassified Microcoleus]|uniref:hypothetical protein n=1 Tax=unclassified Microcoleus TaxID=2642155 RepID=UPI002FD23706